MTNTLTNIQLQASIDHSKIVIELAKALDYENKSYAAFKLFSHYELKFQIYDRDEDMGKPWTWLNSKEEIRNLSEKYWNEYKECKEALSEILKGIK